MESLYYVLCWACHRRCRHCYEERFHPYTGAALETVVRQAEANAPRIIGHFPPTMTYRTPDGAHHRGRVILAGGEVLLEPVFTRALLPALGLLKAKYRDHGGVKLVVQTTGDRVTASALRALLGAGLDHLSVSGLDDFHKGMDAGRRDALRADLTRLFHDHGMEAAGAADHRPGPGFSFFGATPDTWIGRIWPRGRAWANGLSTATMSDNFCNAWSGGLGFLNHGEAGSEVAIAPDGGVYPCCLKTRHAIGSLLDEPLVVILDSLKEHPAFQAIAAGHPEQMGLSLGWSADAFRAACTTTTPDGRAYANLCVGCDRFHDAVLGPVIQALTAERQRRRAGGQPAA